MGISEDVKKRQARVIRARNRALEEGREWKPSEEDLAPEEQKPAAETPPVEGQPAQVVAEPPPESLPAEPPAEPQKKRGRPRKERPPETEDQRDPFVGKEWHYVDYTEMPKRYRKTLCGQHMSRARANCTIDKLSVTCKRCLAQLGILPEEPKP